MSTQFQLTTLADMYMVTILVENFADPFYLCHKNEGGLGWTSDRVEAKRFMYKIEAIEYVLEKTQIRRYREPHGDGFLEVRFDEKRIVVVPKVGERTFLTFDQAQAIHSLPIFKAKRKEPVT
jgi:hypothetical protein